MKQLKWVLVMVALAVGMPGLGGYGEEPKKEPKKRDETITEDLSKLMRRKLQDSQKVLEGIALKDFGMIARHADDLSIISRQAEWKVFKTPAYDLYSAQFRREAEDLVRQAKGKNLDGAALAYIHLTLTCVACHKYVREVRNVRLDRTAPTAVVRTER